MEVHRSYGRVEENTAPHINERILDRTRLAARRYAHESKSARRERLQELNREWDIERVLEANAATLSLIGIGLAMRGDRRWLALPVIVGGFLLQHAIQGWCPPLPLFRRLGFRTPAEISEEKFAIRNLNAEPKG